MIQRIVRALFHLAGWLMTPIVAILAAAIGATGALVFAPGLSTTVGLVLAGVGGLIGSAVGLWLWLGLLRGSPKLQDVLAVTPEGVPTDDAMDDVIGQDSPEREPDL